MSEDQKSYKQIFKATSLFGGVQVIKIIVSIIQSKLIAVLLGPSGMGIAGLLTTAVGLISGITNLGLGTSAVRDISNAKQQKDSQKTSRVIMVLKKLVYITGLLGLILTFILSSQLSQLTFGNEEYTTAFKWLSITLFFDQLTSANNVILQGMQKLQYLAKANVIGSILSLLVSIPLYYFYHIDGIVPAIIITSFLSLTIAYYFSRKLKIEPIKISFKQTLYEGKSMMILGFMLSLSGLMTIGTSYIIRAYINHSGSLTDVGLYSAGFSIIGSYVGLIFTAMSTDYYPRLAAISGNNQGSKELINQQAEIGLLILGPILCGFLIFANWAIILLYSTQFTPINSMVQWAALGMFFKVIGWAIAFVFIANGKSKLFFWNELTFNTYFMLFNIVGYKFWGLDGLGIFFFISYIIYFIQVYFLAFFKFHFRLNKSFTKIFIFQLLAGILCFIIINFLVSIWAYIVGIIIIIISMISSLYELNKRLGLKKTWSKYIQK